MAGIPGTNVTRVPVVIAAASSSVMNLGDPDFLNFVVTSWFDTGLLHFQLG